MTAGAVSRGIPGLRGRRCSTTGSGAGAAAASLAARLQSMQMHISPSPDAAAFAGKAFSRVAANIPFALGGRGRTYLSEEASDRSRSGSRMASG